MKSTVVQKPLILEVVRTNFTRLVTHCQQPPMCARRVESYFFWCIPCGFVRRRDLGGRRRGARCLSFPVRFVLCALRFGGRAPRAETTNESVKLCPHSQPESNHTHANVHAYMCNTHAQSPREIKVGTVLRCIFLAHMNPVRQQLGRSECDVPNNSSGSQTLDKRP